MQAVFSLIIDGRVRAIHDRVRDLLIAVGGQGMHVDGVGIGQLKVVVIDAPGIFELLAILQILFSGDGVRAPALCIDDDGILGCLVQIVGDLQLGAGRGRYFVKVVHVLLMQVISLGISQGQVHAQQASSS